MRTAIGLAISGREVRLATLTSEKDRISVTALDTIYLETSLEHQAPREEVIDNKPSSDVKDVFGLKDGWEDTSTESSSRKESNTNLEILYKFLFKHVTKKTKVALNIPVSMAKYQRLDSAEFKQADDLLEKASTESKEAEFGSEQHLLKLADGATISLVHDQYPPFLTILREVNDFLGKKLFFGTMDTTELALVNIARSNRHTEHGKTTVIVYIEDDFTRLIFLNGYELLHISSIINENAASPQILDVISRRLMYEIDEVKLPDMNTILLAGRCSRIRAKTFFAEQFKNADVDYLAATGVGTLPVDPEKQEEFFSEFAVAIALAWKQLQPKNPAFFPLNLIPQNLKDQQEILKLDRYGYGLLALTGLIAFFITFEIISVRIEASTLKMKNTSLQDEIEHARNSVNNVLDLEDQSKKLETNLSLVDELAEDHDSFLVFLKKLNRSVQSTGDVWVNQITKNGTSYSMNGLSQSRLKIPILADKLGGAILNKVTREKTGQNPTYQFSMDNIRFEKAEEPTEEGLSLANFTKYPNFTKDLFGENGEPAQSSSTPTRQQPQYSPPRTSNGSNRVTTPARNTTQRPSNSSNRVASQPRNTTQRAANNSSRVASQPSNTTQRPSSSSSRVASPARNTTQRASNSSSRVPSQTPAQRSVSNGTAKQQSKSDYSTRDSARQSTKPAESPQSNRVAQSKQTRPSSRSTENMRSSAQQRPAENDAQSFSAKRYFIEVAKSESRSYAEKFAEACRSKGLSANVANAFDRSRGKHIYRILLGNYPNRSNAEKAYAILADALGAAAMKNARIVALDMPANN